MAWTSPCAGAARTRSGATRTVREGSRRAGPPRRRPARARARGARGPCPTRRRRGRRAASGRPSCAQAPAAPGAVPSPPARRGAPCPQQPPLGSLAARSPGDPVKLGTHAAPTRYGGTDARVGPSTLAPAARSSECGSAATTADVETVFRDTACSSCVPIVSVNGSLFLLAPAKRGSAGLPLETGKVAPNGPQFDRADYPRSLCPDVV